MPSTRSSPAIVPAHILGGYGRVGETARVDNVTGETALPGTELDVSLYRALGWLVTIWAPMVISFFNSYVKLFTLSLDISLPLLHRSPLPITRHCSLDRIPAHRLCHHLLSLARDQSLPALSHFGSILAFPSTRQPSTYHNTTSLFHKRFRAQVQTQR